MSNYGWSLVLGLGFCIRFG